MNSIWILVLVFQVTGGQFAVGFSQKDDQSANEYPHQQACLDAAKEKLEHKPKYVVQAKTACVEMPK